MSRFNAESRILETKSTQGDRLAASALAVQLAGIVVLLVLDLVGLLRGEEDKASQAIMLMVTWALLAAFVAFVARALRRGRAGARIPAVVWNVMLLPVGIDLVRSGRWPEGVVLLLTSVAVFAGCVMAFRADPRL